MLHANMREAAIVYAARQSWDAVFESVFHIYAEGIRLYAAARPALASAGTCERGTRCQAP